MASKATDYWQVLSARAPKELVKQVEKLAKAKSGKTARIRTSDIVRMAVAEYVATHALANSTARAA